MTYAIGFLGGGQLARMSIQAAQRMGLSCVSLDRSGRTPAAKIAPHVQGSLASADDIRKIFDVAERVTLENEFIPAETIHQALATGGHSEDRLLPGLRPLGTLQDKLLQRQAYEQAGVPSPRAVALEGDGEAAIEEIGFPMVLKARFGGYDGKGTRYARTYRELSDLRSTWGGGGWLAEKFVAFERELAVMAVVSREGASVFPTVQTVQENSVCDLVFPCEADGSDLAVRAIRAVGGIGLFGVEIFQAANGDLLVNEMAPRPHNSGHYTLDWGGPSQFEYQVRSVMGFEMAPPESNGFAVMANLFGQAGAGEVLPAIRAALEEPYAFVHWYEKDEAKPGRKMGHLNVAGLDLAQLNSVVEAAKRARTNFYRAWTRG